MLFKFNKKNKKVNKIRRKSINIWPLRSIGEQNSKNSQVSLNNTKDILQILKTYDQYKFMKIINNIINN